MVLVLCVNSFIMTAGFYESESEKEIFRISIHKSMTADDFYFQLSSFAALSGVHGRFAGAIIASVAPSLTVPAFQAAEKLCGTKPYLIGPGIKTGIDIKINDPGQLGADLVAMSAGVTAKYPLPAVLINVGEAVTVSYIDDKSRYLGTVIYAGMGAVQRSLVENTELINPVSLLAPEKVLGSSTEESVRSGLIFGTAGLLDAIIQRIGDEYPVKSVIATGVDAMLVLPHCKCGMEYDSSLLCDGMFRIFGRQRHVRQ